MESVNRLERSIPRELLNEIVWQLPNGVFHREFGPAVKSLNGYEEWWLEGKLHRSKDPAIVKHNGDKEWWFNGVRHRIDGPAIEYADGIKEYWLNGKEFSEKEFLIKIKKL